MAAKQAAAGTPATPAVGPTIKSPLSGGGIAPVLTTAQLSETDASRDVGVTYVQTSGVSGSPASYVRDGSAGFWLAAALGADAITGPGPNYTHIITPANNLPYITVWRNVADTLFEQYTDCKVSGLTIAAGAGQPLTQTVALEGRLPARLTADPSVTPAIPLENSYVYNYNDATVTLSGGVTALVSSFSLDIVNNVSPQQTDDVIPYDVVAGLRQFDLTFDIVFADLTEYNKFYYGGASGTSMSNAVYTTSADFLFSHGANNSIEFSLPSIAYEAFPVDVNTNGNPITVSVKAIGQRNGSTPILTSTVKNQVALY
jgi:hypothetical protein